MTAKPIPTDEQMLELLALMHRGDTSEATRTQFMRGAVYYGAIAKGLTAPQAFDAAQSPHVELLGRDLQVKVE